MNSKVRKTPSGIYNLAQHESGDYWYFIPNPLPPSLTYDDELMNLAMDAQRYLSELGTRSAQVPNVSLFVNAFMQKEAEFSCQIEGTKSSILDAIEKNAGLDSSQRPNDSEDILNYLRALEAGVEIMNHKEIDLWFIRSIHEQLIAHQPEKNPGSFRENQNQIGGILYKPSTADFVPPPPFQMKEAMDALEKFIQKSNSHAPLIKIALIHAQFETIHPFKDGNGRVGRLLITFQLCKEKIIDKPVLYLSYFFKKYKDEYNAHLQAIHDEGTWEEWLKFFFKGVIESSRSALGLANNILALQEREVKKIRATYKQGKADSPLRLLMYLFLNPIVSGEDIRTATGRGKPYCYELLDTFEELGILVEYTGNQRNRRFGFKSYLDLLNSVRS